MRIEARIEKDALSFEVEVTNTAHEPLYLQNWLSDWYGLLGVPELNESLNPHAPRVRQLAYVCLGPRGEAVLLNGDGPDHRRAEFPPRDPATQSFQEYVNATCRCSGPLVPRLPRATRLSPGETFKGEIRLPLPLVEWSAYAPPRKEPTVPVTVFTLRYCLEAALESESRRAPSPVPATPGAWHIHSATTFEQTIALPEPITLLRRTDYFARFG